MAEEDRELTPLELKAFLVYASQNLNPQQEKAVAEFLSGSDRKLAYGIWKALILIYHMAPLVSGD